MITKQSTLNQIEIDAFGNVLMRIAKLVIDGEQVLAKEWHRSSVAVGADINAQMAAVNADLVQQGWPPVADGDIERISQHAATAWTPDRIAAASLTLDAELERKRSELAEIERKAAATIYLANARMVEADQYAAGREAAIAALLAEATAKIEQLSLDAAAAKTGS